MCYVKGQLKRDILASDLPEDPYLARSIARAFPARLVERFGDGCCSTSCTAKSLRRRLGNDLVDLMGITFIERHAAKHQRAALQQS
jgi:glutamate dehydrogenase